MKVPNEILDVFFFILFKKKYVLRSRTHVCVYYENYDQFRQKSFITAKSRHPEDSKLVRQVHVVQ